MDWLAAYLTIALIVVLGVFGSQCRKIGWKIALGWAVAIGLLWLPVIVLVAAVLIWPQKSSEIERNLIMEGSDQWK